MTQEKQFQVGDQVILGEHQADPNGKYFKDWASDMDPYVGAVATITTVCGTLLQGAGTYYKVDVDGGRRYWRGINMTPVFGSHGECKTPATTYGARCTRCQEFNEYTPASDSFICYGCRN